MKQSNDVVFISINVIFISIKELKNYYVLEIEEKKNGI